MCQIDNEIFNIVRIQIRSLQPVPTVVPFQDATMGPFATHGLSIITIEDENGQVGEAPVYQSYTNILKSCLFPILFHSHNAPYKEFYPQLYWSIRNEGFKGPAGALLGQMDMALYDLAARRKNIPLYKYIGAKRNAVKMYGSGGGVNYSYSELEDEIATFMKAGVDCYKMKVGKDFGTKLQEDIERVKFVKQLLGPNIRLAVDANQIWTCDNALRFLDAVGEENIHWLEEPVHSASYEQIAMLCKKTSVTIAYGESERTAKIFPTLVNSGVRHLQPVPMQIGSIREWMEVRDLAQRHGFDFSSGGYSLYTSSLMASAAENCPVEYLYSLMYGLEKYFLEYPQWKEGKFFLPEIAGLPVRINWELCYKENRVTAREEWNRNHIPEYKPSVSI